MAKWWQNAIDIKVTSCHNGGMELKIIARGDCNILDSRLIEHMERVRVLWPEGETYPPLSGPRDLVVFRDHVHVHGILDDLVDHGTIYWSDVAYTPDDAPWCPPDEQGDPEKVLQRYYQFKVRDHADCVAEVIYEGNMSE